MCCLSDRLLRYYDFLHLDPVRIGYPLRGKALKFFDSMEGSMVEELTYKTQPFMVRDMGCGFLAKRLAIEILSEISRLSSTVSAGPYMRKVGLDDGWGDRCTNRNSI